MLAIVKYPGRDWRPSGSTKSGAEIVVKNAMALAAFDEPVSS